MSAGPDMKPPGVRNAGEFATHVDHTVTVVEALASTGSRADGKDGSHPAPNVTGNNVIHQRRRVNPESLALRLGPDLVRDLDALITPGNTEMPSFAVRKELQERYNIDRRHIYDYFHSRGLRVVKEDKHGNPVSAKDALIALPNLRPLRQTTPIKISHSHPAAAERKLPFKPRGVTKAKLGRPRKNPAQTNPRIVPITRETSESSESADAPPSEYSPSRDPTPYVADPLVPFPSAVEEHDNCTVNSVMSPLDQSFSVRRVAIGDIAYAYRHKLLFERMQELTDYPTMLALTDGRSIFWNETSPCSTGDPGLLLPHAKPLSWDERQAIYKSVSDSLGPAHGIQECQGTYRKHMQARTKLYFEGLLPGPFHAQQPVRTSVVLDRKPLGTNEFRHWLSETRYLKHEDANGSPRLRVNHRDTNMAKQQHADSADDKRYRQIPIPYWIPTLDELFPTPAQDANDDDTITDSPVIHTREVTRMTAHTRVADECSATRGRLLFSATSDNASLLVLPITSVAETHQTGCLQLHGLSGFPGAQEVKTQMPLDEMDSHPLRPVHPPYVTHPGQHYPRADTQRRGRKTSNNAHVRLPSCSPRQLQMRDIDRICWTRPVTSRDVRRRTPSAAGDI